MTDLDAMMICALLADLRDALDDGQRVVTSDDRMLARTYLVDALEREPSDSEVSAQVAHMRDVVQRLGAPLGLTCAVGGIRLELPHP